MIRAGAPTLAALCIAAPLAAQERADVRLLGSMAIGAALDSGDKGVGLFREGEIELNATVVLSEDVKVTGHIEIEAHSSFDQIDESYVTLHTNLGRFKIGGDDAARVTYTSGVIYSPGSRIGYYDTIPLAKDSAMAFIDSTGDPVGVYYDSPSIDGFRFGLSYHPDVTADGLPFQAAPGIVSPGDTTLIVFAADGTPDPSTGDDLLGGEQFSVGGSYDREIGDNGFGLSAGWSTTEGLPDVLATAPAPTLVCVGAAAVTSYMRPLPP